MCEIRVRVAEKNCGLYKSMAICLTALFGFAVNLNAQTVEEFARGSIREKVFAQTAPKHSYALYLPTAYAPEKKSAILYIFDPVAGGAFAVERFRPAAEKYNYILIGSNNSRNGLDGALLQEIMKVLWKDTHERFNVDEKRVYAAGFSGGARVASLFATICPTCIAGIIGSGAGFSTQIKPTARQKFIFFGAVGADDYNFPELINLEKTLVELNITNRLEIFGGIHQWLPPESGERALAWMTLQAMKKGDLSKDAQFIAEILAYRVAEAKNFLSAGKTLETSRAYRAIVSDFSGLKDVSEYSQKFAEINNSPEFAKARKYENELLKRQFQLADELTALGAKRLNSENTNSLSAVRSFIADLNKKSESPNEDERHVAKRALAQVFAVCLETAIFINERQKKFDLAIANLELAAEVASRNGYIRFELAKAYALDGQRKKALSSLEDAVKLGFQNAKQIENEEVFAGLRTDARFQKLIDRFQTK